MKKFALVVMLFATAAFAENVDLVDSPKPQWLRAGAYIGSGSATSPLSPNGTAGIQQPFVVLGQLGSANGQNLELVAPGALLNRVYEMEQAASGAYQVQTGADTTFTALGLPAPTIINGGGTCTPAADVTDLNFLSMIKYPTDGTVNHSCAISGPFTTTRWGAGPIYQAIIRTDPAAITNTRVYAGISAADASQFATLAASNGTIMCMFRFDTGLSDVNFQAQSSDGTTASVIDTGVVYSAATSYALMIDASTAGACDFYINGTLKVHKVTNISVATTILGIETSITNITSGTARALSIGRVNLQQH